MSRNRTNNPKFIPPSAKGCIIVNNGEYNKRIHLEELSKYLEQGFVRGRVK